MLWETANGNECGRTTATIIFFWALRISLGKLRLSDAFGRRSSHHSKSQLTPLFPGAVPFGTDWADFFWQKGTTHVPAKTPAVSTSSGGGGGGVQLPAALMSLLSSASSSNTGLLLLQLILTFQWCHVFSPTVKDINIIQIMSLWRKSNCFSASLSLSSSFLTLPLVSTLPPPPPSVAWRGKNGCEGDYSFLCCCL